MVYPSGMAPRIIVPVSILLIAVLGTLTWQIQTRTSAATQEMARRELADLAHGTGRSHLHLSERCPEHRPTPWPAAWARRSKAAFPFRASCSWPCWKGCTPATAPPSARVRYGSPGAFDGPRRGIQEYARQRCRGRFIPYTAPRRAGYPAYGVRKGRLLPGTQNQKKPYLTPPYMYEVGARTVPMTRRRPRFWWTEHTGAA